MKSRLIFGAWVASGSLMMLGTVSGAPNDNRSPLRIEQTSESNYPPSVLADGIRSGEAWLMITVDEAGSLTDAMVIGYTHPGFTAEALRAVRTLEFTPARVNGAPVPVRTELHLSFEASGQVVTLDPRAAVNQLTAFSYPNPKIRNLCAPTELDRLPVPTETIAPRHPGNVNPEKIAGGKVMLDFVIDERGIPRMPVVVSSTDPQYSAAAADALNQWRFTPPVRRGKPVAVQVRQEFVFSDTTHSKDPTGLPAKRFSVLANGHDRPRF